MSPGAVSFCETSEPSSQLKTRQVMGSTRGWRDQPNAVGQAVVEGQLGGGGGHQLAQCESVALAVGRFFAIMTVS